MDAATRERGAFPDGLGSPRAKLVYLYLASAGEATPTELTERLSLDKMTVLSILRSLARRDLVARTGSAYICTES